MANTPIVTKDQLIREVAKSEGITVATMRDIYNTLEDKVIDHLSSATPTDSIIVKLLDGVSIECHYIPEKEIEHPETREIITTPEKIWSKSKVTRYFNRKINKFRVFD